MNAQGNRQITTTFNAQLIVNAMVVFQLDDPGGLGTGHPFCLLEVDGATNPVMEVAELSLVNTVPGTLSLTAAFSVIPGTYNVEVKCKAVTTGSANSVSVVRSTMTVVAVAE